MKKSKLPLKAISFLMVISMIMPALLGFPTIALGSPAGAKIDGVMGEVRLITGDVMEIEFDTPVLNNEDAHATFDVLIDGVAVEWTYLSYFAFGDYAAKPVVNIRLAKELEIGQIRARCRESAANAEYDRTENTVGPVTAAGITVKAGDVTKTATWQTFYSERSQGYMSRFWTYASRKAGSNGSVLFNHNGTINANNIFTNAEKPLYTDEYIARMVGEGTNKFLGRAEYLSLPMIYAGYRALIVGPAQSVYEAPEYRELYKHGETTDTFTRKMIKATEVPGNFDPATGEYKKPYIVGTSDDVMRHYAPIQADGTPATGNADSARPKSDHFYFAEAFFDIAYELAVVQGSQKYPLTEFNKSDDYRFDLHLEEAYNKAKAAGKWQGTRLMDSVKDYYIFGNLAFQEFIPETKDFERESYPVNTRQEVYEYDYPLYWALSGIHGKWCFWAGKGNAQTSQGSTDGSKVNTPWWWRNQPDNFTYASAISGSVGVEHAPLQIVRAEIAASNRLHIYFNREVSTISNVMLGENWKIYIDGREVEVSVTSGGGYLWRGISLATSGTADRLDNGKPYGRSFSGFTQKDLDERSVANGGWISNNQSLGEFALEKGQYIGLEDAIRDYGAGAVGKVEVAYVGSTAANAVKDWNGVEMPKGEKFEAEFKPWIGHVYRSPVGGVYVYLDTWVADGQIGDINGDGIVDKGYYMYRNEPSQPTAKDVAMAAGHQYDTILTNNNTTTYPNSAGGADFDNAFATGTGSSTGTSPAYSWNNGRVTFNTQTLTNDPVTYDKPGLRIGDGFTRGGGGVRIAAGSVLGHHAGMQGPGSLGGSDVGENLRIEGWGGMNFQTEDVGVLRDFNLSRYRNESLVFHEGGHGVDSATPAYAQNIYNDISTAYATATAPANGIRYFSVDGVRTYVGARGEYVSTGNTFYSGTMREQFEGKIDPTWTPVSNRIELHQYDPYAMEAFKRAYFNGDLNLWYDNDTGNPAKRVIPADWTLLRDLGQTDPRYAFAKDWDEENDLVAWGLGVPAIAQNNPYTGWHNPLVKWVSYAGPSIWRNEPYKEPTRDDWRKDIRFDPIGSNPYYPNADGSQSFKSLEHPFYYGEGVPMPERPAELAALVAPISGKIVEGSLKMVSKVLFEFKLRNYTGELNMDNAAPSFTLTVDGAPTHFYFWTFEGAGDVATVQLRVDWPIEDDSVLKLKVNETGQTVISNAVLKLNMDKWVIEKGDYFNLSPAFSRAINSNVAVLDYAFDKNLFEYRGFTEAPGVTLVNKEDTDTGVRITVMVLDYAMKDFGKFLFSAKEIADLKLEKNQIGLTVNYVLKDGDEKATFMAKASTRFVTSDGTDPTNPGGEFTLITLSNAIDYFGVKRGDAQWEVAQFFDYTRAGIIDITNITYVASRIVLE